MGKSNCTLIADAKFRDFNMNREEQLIFWLNTSVHNSLWYKEQNTSVYILYLITRPLYDYSC